MKLKKKHFKKLKEIAMDTRENGVLGTTAFELQRLITEIESVQKIPVEDMIYSIHRKDVEDNIQKERDAMVAVSTDNTTEFKGSLRDILEGYKPPLYVTHPITGQIVAFDYLSNEDHDELEKDWLNTAKDLKGFVPRHKRDKNAPKIGDVGYFWMTDTDFTSFGKILEIHPTGFQINNGTFFPNFSKTPPELK